MSVNAPSKLSTKTIKKSSNFTKINSKKNLRIMDDPAFHLNRTLKAYINKRLNKNESTDKAETINCGDTNDYTNNSKIKETSISFNRAKTFTNIINQKHYYSKKKTNKRQKLYSKSRKKLTKSNSTNKFNLTHYLYFYKNKSINFDIKNKPKFTKKNSNNSTQKFRYSGSTALSMNDTNPLPEKIFPYSNNNNQLLSNHSTLDVNSNAKNSGVGQTTSKKSKFTAQYFERNLNEGYSGNSRTNLSNKKFKKRNKYKNINLIKGRQNLMKRYENNMFINKNVKNLNASLSINLNNNNKTANNINYLKMNDINKSKNYKNNNDNVRYLYNVMNNKSNCNNSITPTKILNNTINVSNTNNNNINLNNENQNENNYYDNRENIFNNSIYLKKIEVLENENKLLKSEIFNSNNKLLLLENKINELLMGKNILEKEECPKPTPYVKKYSKEGVENLNQSPLDIFNNENIYSKQNEEERKNVFNNNADIAQNINKNKIKTPKKINANKGYPIKPKDKRKGSKKINKLKITKNKSEKFKPNNQNIFPHNKFPK